MWNAIEINLQEKYPWLKEMDSCILRTSLDNLYDANNRYFKGETRFPRFKAKNNHERYKTICNRSTYKGKNYGVFEREGRDQLSSSSKKGAELELGIRRLRFLVRSWLCDFGLVASTL